MATRRRRWWRGSSRGPSRPYKLWFNSSSAAEDAVRPHLRKLEVLVRRLARAHTRLRFEFLAGASFEIPVGEPLA